MAQYDPKNHTNLLVDRCHLLSWQRPEAQHPALKQDDLQRTLHLRPCGRIGTVPSALVGRLRDGNVGVSELELKRKFCLLEDGTISERFGPFFLSCLSRSSLNAGTGPITQAKCQMKQTQLVSALFLTASRPGQRRTLSYLGTFSDVPAEAFSEWVNTFISRACSLCAKGAYTTGR